MLQRCQMRVHGTAGTLRQAHASLPNTWGVLLLASPKLAVHRQHAHVQHVGVGDEQLGTLPNGAPAPAGHSAGHAAAGVVMRQLKSS